MKWIKYIDLPAQSFLILSAIVSLSISRFEPQLDFLFIQLVMGTVQMLSSILSIVLTGQLRKEKSIHFVLAICYLTSLLLIRMGDGFLDNPYSIIPAWILALYYYYLSWRSLFNHSRRSKFLPHLGF